MEEQKFWKKNKRYNLGSISRDQRLKPKSDLVLQIFDDSHQKFNCNSQSKKNRKPPQIINPSKLFSILKHKSGPINSSQHSSKHPRICFTVQIQSLKSTNNIFRKYSTTKHPGAPLKDNNCPNFIRLKSLHDNQDFIATKMHEKKWNKIVYKQNDNPISLCIEGNQLKWLRILDDI